MYDSDIISLSNIDKDKRYIVGGKAYNTSRLATLSSKFKVAEGFVLTTDFFDKYVSSDGYPRHKEGFLSSIVEKIQSIQLGQSDANRIANFLNETKFPLIARSSATLEDSRTYSFAGIFSSFPNIISLSQLLTSIKNCWASLYNQRVFHYCEYHNIDMRDLKMSVLVQKQIHADKSGVIFTKNPQDMHYDELIIEAVQGQGDKLVSGDVNPQRYIVTRRDLHVTLEDSTQPNSRLLTYQELIQLVRCSIEIESFFGHAQDIEWSISGNQIFVHQSRDLGIAII